MVRKLLSIAVVAACVACGATRASGLPVVDLGDDGSASRGVGEDGAGGLGEDATVGSSSNDSGAPDNSTSGTVPTSGAGSGIGSSTSGQTTGSGNPGSGSASSSSGNAASGSAATSGSSSGASGGSSGSGASAGASANSGTSGTSTSSGASSGSTSGALCTYGTPTNGTGSFTWYYFGQGTYQQDGSYLTACGYQGSESGMIDSVTNIASAAPASDTYFAAIPGSSGFNTVNDCGACVEITNGANSIVATIIDECPTDNGQNPLCTHAGHLDLSYAAWSALHYSSGDPSGTTWKFVSCPVAGDIVTRVKSGNPDQVYIQNTVLPIVAVSYQGQAANHLSYGVWQLPNGAAASGATLVLTDVEGHTVTITVNGGNSGKQFPDRCP